MTRKRRGQRGGVHIFKPARSVTWWMRYTVNGKKHRTNTKKTNEAEARIMAANVARMVGLANSDSLEEKRVLLEICRGLMREIPELEAEAALLGDVKNLPTTREWFARELEGMQKNTTGDDRAVKATSVDRVRQVVDDFMAFLAAQLVNLGKTVLIGES